MQQLFLFLYRYRAFLIFVFLEFLSGWLVVQNNRYQSAAFFNSSNSIVAQTLDISNRINYFFNLRNANRELAEENAKLKRQLSKYWNKRGYEFSRASNFIFTRYKFEAARVINNSTARPDNYLTINKGTKSGVQQGMGVVTSSGIVGKVKSVSKNFATVVSFLHSNYFVSAKLDVDGTFGSLKWDGFDPSKARLIYIPKHVKVSKGDSVYTSGYNSIYPENILLGIVEEFEIKDDGFYDILVDLQTDYGEISYVYVIKDELIEELDSIQSDIQIEDE